jgi:cell division protein FtsL
MASLRWWGFGLLSVLLVLSALAVVGSKYYARLLFVEIQRQEDALDQYEAERGQTQLELTMLAEHKGLEQVALKDLKMVVPVRDKIIYLKP